MMRSLLCQQTFILRNRKIGDPEAKYKGVVNSYAMALYAGPFDG